jgi:dihydrofolate synthase/folylpolyglutamate synthase
MQKLADGPLTARVPGASVWVDGAHNPAAARAVAQHLAPGFALVLGVLATKDHEQVVRAFAGRAGRLVAVPVPGHSSADPAALVATARGAGMIAQAAESLRAGLDAVAGAERVLIAGSLHLAGEALAMNGQTPT